METVFADINAESRQHSILLRVGENLFKSTLCMQAHLISVREAIRYRSTLMNKQLEERSDLTYRLDGLRRAQAALLLHCPGATQTIERSWYDKKQDTRRGSASPSSSPKVVGLCPWFGLWPMKLRGKARTGGTAHHQNHKVDGAAKPRLTSGGEAVAGRSHQAEGRSDLTRREAVA